MQTFLPLYTVIFVSLVLLYVFYNGVFDFIRALLHTRNLVRSKRSAAIRALRLQEFSIVAKRLEELWAVEAKLRNPLWIISLFIKHVFVAPFLHLADGVARFIATRAAKSPIKSK
jgi:hypothetical protein